MDNIDRLARKIADMFKENMNPPSTAPRVGKVINAEPLEIQWGDSIILKKDKLHVPKGFSCQDGDELTIVPDENLKMFFVMNILEGGE